MNGYNASVPADLPPRIARLPVSPEGWPIPFFVCREPLDFRVIRPGAIEACHNHARCWICGEPRGRNFAFTVGPMCGINRVSSEPPAHLECATFAARVCPFLARPRMRRNERDIPEEAVEAAGFAIARNPGATLVWSTRSYKPFRAHAGAAGVLFELGEPLALQWFANGRPATREEVSASISSGVPELLAACEEEATERERAAARLELARRRTWLEARLPA